MPSTKQAVLITLMMAALAFTVSAQLARASAPDLWPFISCNAAGNEKLTFALGENVYGKGGFFWPNQQVSIYIIPTRIYPTPSHAMAPPVNVTTDSLGHVPITLIWTATAIGNYAVWVDANQNGKYDEGVDGYYHFCYCYLFNVVPEYIVGSIGAVAAMIGAFALYRRKSTKQTKEPTQTQLNIRQN